MRIAVFMDYIKVPITLDSKAKLPIYATVGSAGADLFCTEEFSLEPLQRRLVGTGLRVAIPKGYEAQIRPRSGFAMKHGLTLVNTPGTIDSDYRGEIKLIIVNLGSETVTIPEGERIGQMVICPVTQAVFTPVDVLDDTDRGEGGFGSSGSR